ncbi:MAG: 2-deoxycytidine 5-triphosphate deaminase, partial [Actinomycetota bacterium]|nr:2-deoxycytidine 5-triphosphate deaminase [Actinomycetota bacterium]
MDLDLPLYRKGVLPCQYIEKAIAARVIDAGRFTIPPENVQPASLDL